ncbi:MAG: protein kinase, partial [Candidatus Tectomicrobia bacterium]|nr:protein kinase [Candidatus Tectomicrobia bacterium]
MARVIPIGEPVNDAERLAIAHLRDHLPDAYLILHNFEIPRQGEFFEVDLAVIAPHAVYLVDVKGTRGLIEVHGPKWYPDGRQPYPSPLLKLRSHARIIKSLITDSQPSRRDLEGIYVDAVILLTAPDAVLQDPGGRDAPNVTTLSKAVAFFRNTARLPGQYSKNIAALHPMIRAALQGVARPRTGPLHFGNWEVVERLGATDQYTEYRGVNVFAGARAGTVLLRVYHADPYLPQEERDAQRRRIANAYLALSHMPGHPGIVGVRDFFPTEAEDRYILVSEDVSAQALRLYLDKASLALTLNQKLHVAEEVLHALAHAHQHDVIHRNLTPSTILLGSDGHVRLTGFDFARAGVDRTRTIAQDIIDELDAAYMAPELHGDPGAATPGADLFSVGPIFYELCTGERPFHGPTSVFDHSGIFPVPASQWRSALPDGFDVWLQRLCTFDPAGRPTAAQAVAELISLSQLPIALEPAATYERLAKSETAPVDYKNLPPGTALSPKYVVERRLGKSGTFGVVYKVIDTLADVSRAVKLILHDRYSTLERLKTEYRILLRTPEYPHVVKVIDADLLPGGGPPFLVFEFIDGLDVGEMIENNLFAPEDALELARQVVAGLAHLHQHGVQHCDIKPRNLLWTEQGAKIIDFNVSVDDTLVNDPGGGSWRYVPPDFDRTVVQQRSDRIDRDLYALGLTLYEAVTGRYPWDTAVPPIGQPAPDPREGSGLSDLAPEFVDILLKAIAPQRAARFPSARDLLTALNQVTRVRRSLPASTDTVSVRLVTRLDADTVIPPNTNPYVSYLLTLYSQSQHSNAGTRGLDAMGEQLYIETALDRELVPAVFAGEFRLVIISGNAGDGKTAFLQKFEARAVEAGARLDRHPNGSRFVLRGRTYLSNYDGSQDEGEHSSDTVLRTFFAPFAGATADDWPANDIRLIAINEGRLVDFLTAECQHFPLLETVVREGFATGSPQHGIAVVNLNLRSVVADSQGAEGSILQRLLRRMTHATFWEPCQTCDLQERCYALHNARTLQDDTAGPKVIERLQTLYTLTHLRGRLHMTLRDIRSALAFMLVGTRDCAGIHELYRSGQREHIAASLYFNSWMGGGTEHADRLLTLLRDVDVGEATDPKLDRALGFASPSDDRSLFRFAARGTYDRDVLRRLFEELPGDFSGVISQHRSQAYRRYVAMARRRAFFERRDSSWKAMLPYHTAEAMLALVRGEESPALSLSTLLHAINRGEGLS